jgi:hypothetical protein
VRNHSAHLYRRPVRVEVAAAPAELAQRTLPPPEAEVTRPSDGGEEEEPQRVRAQADVSLPTLAAAPA